jgi:hypothetical protein
LKVLTPQWYDPNRLTTRSIILAPNLICEGSSMTGRKSYDQQLRSIGQSLEAQRINVFELSRQGDQYVVKGEPEKETSLLATLRNWQKRHRSDGLSSSLNFTDQDIDQLERQGRANRSKSNNLPDFHSLPNTLRTVGSYLEQKESELIELHKKQLSVSILSRSKAGYPEFEERSLGSFYDLFLRLHERRGKAQS